MKKALIVAALIVISVFMVSCQNDNRVTELTSGPGIVLCKNGESFSLYETPLTAKMKLSNTDYGKLSVTVYSTNGKSATLSAEKGDTDKCRAIGGKLCAAEICVDGEKTAYALSDTGFTSVVENGEAENINLLRHITVSEEYTVSRPITVNTHKYQLTFEKKLYFICDDEGIFQINGSLQADDFAASAPLCSIFLPSSYEINNADFYINAASLNGEAITPNLRVCETEEELEYICSLPCFYDPATETILIRDLTLEKEITMPAPCILMEENCELQGNFKIETEEKGNIILFGHFSLFDIKLNAPNCDLNCQFPCAISEAVNKINVKTLNGYNINDYRIGGEGKATITSATFSSEGRNMTKDMVWKAKGTILYCSYKGVVAPSELKNAKLEFVSDGRVILDGSAANEDGTVDLTDPLGVYATVTDKNGKTKKYRIVTDIEAKLPVVIIETENNAPIESKEEYINATMTVESDFADDVPSCATSNVRIKGRGNSTWAWSYKVPYIVKYEEDVSLLGLNKGKKWVLLANYSDKSLIRNYVALEMAKALDNMDCYATQYPVDVFLGGEYVGVYTLGEKIEEGKERVKVFEDATSVDTGFFMELGVYEEDEVNSVNCFSTEYMSYVYIHEPGENKLTEKHETYIKNYMTMADFAVKNLNGYDSFIDVDSLIDWLIMTEVAYNSDGAMRRSVFFKKDHDGKIEMGPMWDFDIAFGNSYTDYDNYEAWACLSTEFGYVYENWICRLMEDEDFVSRLRHRWNEIKFSLEKSAMSAINYGYEITAPSTADNFKKWDILSVPVTIQPEYMAEYDTYEKQIEYLRDFILKRMEWIDKQLNGEKYTHFTEKND